MSNLTLTFLGFPSDMSWSDVNLVCVPSDMSKLDPENHDFFRGSFRHVKTGPENRQNLGVVFDQVLTGFMTILGKP
jgi:hypothetical protein